MNISVKMNALGEALRHTLGLLQENRDNLHILDEKDGLPGEHFGYRAEPGKPMLDHLLGAAIHEAETALALYVDRPEDVAPPPKGAMDRTGGQ
jgi:hypothetical protein